VKVLTAGGGYTELSASDTGFLEGGSLGIGEVRLIGSLGDPIQTATYEAIYRSNPWLWAAVNVKARTIGRLPLHVFELDESSDRRRVRSDTPGTTSSKPARDLDELLRKPDPRFSRQALIRSTARSRLVHGNSLWEKIRAGGRVVECRRVPWRSASPIWADPLTCQTVAGWKISEGYGNTRTLSVDEVVHFGAGDDLDSPIATSPIASLRSTVALYEVMVRHLAKFFANHARPSAHVKVPSGLKQEQIDLIRSEILKLYQGASNAGQVVLTSGEWTPITASHEHTQILELIKLSREEVLAALGVPPPLAGVLDRAILNNVKELRSFYLRDSVGPDVDDFEGEIQSQLIDPEPRWQYLFAEFQLAEQLRPDPQAESEILDKRLRWASIDENRKIQNLPPFGIEGVTDVPLIRAGERPITQPDPGAPADPADEDEGASAPAKDDDITDELDELDDEEES